MSGGMSRWALRLTVVGVASLWMGCATIMNGTTQDIGITSIPSGAAVTVDAETRGQTPLVTPVARRSSHTVKVELEGYHPVEGTLTRHANGWVWGNLAIGGLVGLSVDLIAGGMYDLYPGRIDATLRPLPAPSDERPPLVSPEQVQVPAMERPPTASLRASVPPQPVYASRAQQPLRTVGSTKAPQCDEPTVRELCPLYQYRHGIYRGTCKDGSGVEVGLGYVKVSPPEMGNPPHPWQAESCTVSAVADATTRP